MRLEQRQASFLDAGRVLSVEEAEPAPSASIKLVTLRIGAMLFLLFGLSRRITLRRLGGGKDSPLVSTIVPELEQAAEETAPKVNLSRMVASNCPRLHRYYNDVE